MSSPHSNSNRSWIARIPLPWISVFVGLLCGLITWLILDPLQSRVLGEFFQSDLENRLEVRAADTRRRFEYFLEDLDKATKSLAQNWRLVRYVYSDKWEQSREKTFVHFDQTTPWMQQGLPLLGAVNPSYVLLLDLEGNPREIYFQQDHPFPIDLALDLFNEELVGVTTTLWKLPYFITWAKIASGAQEERAILMLVMPINEQFLSASQQYAGLDGIVIGLFEGDQQILLASSSISEVNTASHLEDWKVDYHVTSQALARYQAPDTNVQFFTFITRTRLVEKLASILVSIRQERLIEALVYVAAFSITFFFISSRLSHILRRISIFGHNALGIEEKSIESGNQLLLLETRLQELFQRVSYVKDETKVAQEHRIRESEALKSALLENSLDPIITVDNKGLIIEANVTAEESFGYPREQLLGNPIDLLAIHPRDHLLIREMLARCREKNSLQRLCQAQRMLSIDAYGREKPIECSVMPIQLKERTVFTIYLRDISERAKAEKRIQSLAKFTSENPSPVLRVNDRGVIIYANSASAPLLDYWGCDRGQTLPLYWRNLVFNAFQDGVNREYEINLEEQIFSLLMVPVLELHYANLYGRDITQVRTAEQQSRQHQSELVHVCRLSTMGEMATGLAHELNQPLSAIVNFASGCVRRLQTGMGGEAELVDAMAQITVQAERAGEIIKRLRALVGKRVEEHSVVNVNHLVLEVASFVEYVAEKHRVDVSLQLYQGPLPAEVDLVQIEQVLLNLVRNAIDAMKQVDIEHRKLALITRKTEDDQVEILVKDTGPGIPADNIDHLFDAFFSTKESGMGMGLPISRKIIEAHNGRISATSELGKGAEFRVLLPSDPSLVLPGF